MPLTSLMLLTLPTPGVTNGPDYATQINGNFSLIDAHDHTSGKGQPISPAGILVNQDFSFLNFSAIGLKSARYQNLTATLGSASDKNCVYVLNGDLYYNNASGTAVRLTAGVGINVASTGTITGDYGGANLASVVYNNTTKAYGLYQGSPNQTNPAKLASSDISLFDFSTVVSPNSVTLKAPAALATSFNLTLPGALPAATKILTVDVSGNMGASYDVDNTSLSIVSGLIGVKPLGILPSHLAARTVASPTATAGNVAQSVSSGSLATLTATSFQALTTTLTTTGKPVIIRLIADGSATYSYFQSIAATGGLIQIKRDGVVIGSTKFNDAYSPILEFMDVCAAGSHVYSLWFASDGTNISIIGYIKLMAYELN